MPSLTARRPGARLTPTRPVFHAQAHAQPPSLAAPYGDEFAALVAAYCDDGLVVTGDDGLGPLFITRPPASRPARQLGQPQRR